MIIFLLEDCFKSVVIILTSRREDDYGSLLIGFNVVIFTFAGLMSFPDVAVSTTSPSEGRARRITTQLPPYRLLEVPTVSSSLVMSPLMTPTISAGPSTLNSTFPDAPIIAAPFVVKSGDTDVLQIFSVSFPLLIVGLG